MLYENGDTYEGGWKDNMRSGRGIYIINNEGGRFIN